MKSLSVYDPEKCFRWRNITQSLIKHLQQPLRFVQLSYSTCHVIATPHQHADSVLQHTMMQPVAYSMCTETPTVHSVLLTFLWGVDTIYTVYPVKGQSWWVGGSLSKRQHTTWTGHITYRDSHSHTDTILETPINPRRKREKLTEKPQPADSDYIFLSWLFVLNVRIKQNLLVQVHDEVICSKAVEQTSKWNLMIGWISCAKQINCEKRSKKF